MSMGMSAPGAGSVNEPDDVTGLGLTTFRVRRADYEPGPVDADVDVDGQTVAAVTPPTPDLPQEAQARAAAGYVVELLVDVLSGRASSDELDGLVTLAVADRVDIDRRAARARELGLASIRVRQPHEGALEATAVCRSGHRALALAARFDHDRRTGWRCTAFALL